MLIYYMYLIFDVLININDSSFFPKSYDNLFYLYIPSTTVIILYLSESYL